MLLSTNHPDRDFTSLWNKSEKYQMDWHKLFTKNSFAIHFCFRRNYCCHRYRPRYRRLFERRASRRPNLIQCGARFPDEILLPQPSSSNKRLRKKRVGSESKESGDISTINEIVRGSEQPSITCPAMSLVEKRNSSEEMGRRLLAHYTKIWI